MNNQPETASNDDWHCGGWEGAEMATLQHGASLTFDQKLEWLEGAQQLIAEIHGWEASLLPSGSCVMPRWMEKDATPPHSTEGGDVGAGGATDAAGADAGGLAR